MVYYELMYKSVIQFGIIYADLVKYSLFFVFFVFCNAFLVPKFCHCKELSAMPIMFKVSTNKIYCPCSCPSLQAFAVFTLYRLLFKMQDFYKNVCFCTRTRRFVVLCIMVALPVDKICSRYQLSPQTLSTVGYGAPNCCLSVSWGQLYILGQCGG